MRLEIATKEIIPELTELAREVEPIFQGSMTDNEEFHNFMISKIEKNEAIIVRDNNAIIEFLGLQYLRDIGKWELVQCYQSML